MTLGSTMLMRNVSAPPPVACAAGCGGVGVVRTVTPSSTGAGAGAVPRPVGGQVAGAVQGPCGGERGHHGGDHPRGAPLLADEQGQRTGEDETGAGAQSLVNAGPGRAGPAHGPRDQDDQGGGDRPRAAAGQDDGRGEPPDVGWFAASVVLASGGAGAVSPALVVLVARAVRGPRSAGAGVDQGLRPGPGLVLAGALALLVGQQWRTAWVVAAVVTALATAWTLHGSRDLTADGPGHGTGTGAG